MEIWNHKRRHKLAPVGLKKRKLPFKGGSSFFVLSVLMTGPVLDNREISLNKIAKNGTF